MRSRRPEAKATHQVPSVESALGPGMETPGATRSTQEPLFEVALRVSLMELPATVRA